MKKILILLAILVPCLTFGQGAFPVLINSTTGASYRYYKDADSNTHYKRPIFFMFKGQGEDGADASTPFTLGAYARAGMDLTFPDTAKGGGNVSIRVLEFKNTPSNMQVIKDAITFISTYDPDVDTTQRILIGLSLGGGPVRTALITSGLSRRFCAAIMCSPTQLVSSDEVLDSVQASGTALFGFDATYDPNGATNFVVQQFKTRVNAGTVGPPAPRIFFPTSSNGISDGHQAGWQIGMALTSQAWFVDRSWETGHSGQTNVAQWIDNVYGQSLKYARTPTGGGNVNPVSNAGSNQTITLPSSGTLNGSGSFDPDGSIAVYAWVKTSGPSGGTISNAGIASPTISSLVSGTYVYTLTVTDNLGATNASSVTVVGNTAPVSIPGSNQTITLPTSSASLAGSGTDADGTIASYSWSQTAGPNTSTIASPSSASTTVSGLIQGSYVYVLSVVDNLGASNSVGVTITVNAATGIPACVINSTPTAAQFIFTLNTATLTWPSTSLATTYDVYLWTGATPPGSPTANTSSLTYSASSLLPHTFYNWYIVPRSSTGPATGCSTNVTSFRTAVKKLLNLQFKTYP